MNHQSIAKARATLDAIYCGDAEDAARMLAEMSDQRVSIDDVQRAADAAVERRALQDSLHKKYPAAFDDRDVAHIADRRYVAYVNAGRSESEAAEMAAAEAVAKLNLGRSNSSHAVPEEADPNPNTTIREMRRARGQGV